MLLTTWNETAPHSLHSVEGMGFSGMALTARLQAKGYTIRSFEKGSEVGGTWFWNRYPGAVSAT